MSSSRAPTTGGTTGGGGIPGPGGAIGGGAGGAPGPGGAIGGGPARLRKRCRLPSKAFACDRKALALALAFALLFGLAFAFALRVASRSRINLLMVALRNEDRKPRISDSLTLSWVTISSNTSANSASNGSKFLLSVTLHCVQSLGEQIIAPTENKADQRFAHNDHVVGLHGIVGATFASA